MELIDGPLYTPEQVSKNQWLGERTPGAIRRAVSRGQLQHTKVGGKVCFSRANILANQEAGLELAETDERVPALPPARKRRAPVTDVPTSVTHLCSRPEARRRSRKAS